MQSNVARANEKESPVFRHGENVKYTLSPPFYRMSSSSLGIFGLLSDIRSYLKELVTFGYTESVRW